MKNLICLTIGLFICLNGMAQEKDSYLFSSQIKKKLEKDSVNWKYQIAAWDYSFIGEYHEALKCWDIQSKPQQDTLNHNDQLRFINYHPVNAQDYIIAKAQTERILIINEAHHIPRHRVFTTSLLEKLYAQGYRFIGFEALDSKDTLINERKYPVHISGFYTEEPQLGNLIRAALKIGFTVFNYEAENGKNGKEREIEEAQNIKKIVDKNPNAKLIIYCGFDHLKEGYVKNWDKAMAGRLAEYTGINPFTVNQVALTEKSDSNYESPLYRFINAKESSVFVDSEQSVFCDLENAKQFDIAVYHPVTSYINGRPDWLYLNGKRQKVQILHSSSLIFPALVYAFHIGEDINTAIPADLIELKNEKDRRPLVLDVGSYVVKIKSINGREEYFNVTLRQAQN
ncbi:hypothetical protein [Solitalea canadensis]|nr:hypothetical protein [Solitalea canadensis]